MLLLMPYVAQPIQSFQAPMSGHEAVVLHGELALLMLPPRIVGDYVTSLSWSGTGRYLVAFGVRAATMAEFKGAISGQAAFNRDRMEVVAYSQANSKTQPLGTIPIGEWVTSFWFPNSDVGVGFLESLPTEPDSGPTQYIVWLNPAVGRLRVAESPLGGFPELIAAKGDGSQAAIISSNFYGQRELTLISSDGRTLSKRSLSLPDGKDPYEAGWISDSVLAVRCMSVENGKRSLNQYFAIDLASGRVVRLASEPALQPAPQVAGFGGYDQVANDMEAEAPSLRRGKLQTVYREMKFDARASVKCAFLISDSEEEPKSALIAADAVGVKISPKEDAVAYLTRGVCLVRPIAKMPKDLYLKMREAAERAVAMSNAKQSALAMLMYAADYDDLLPRREGDWVDVVNPYCKNTDILRSFVFTFNGTRMDVENPAETELGYVEGPNGRAVAYLDGHVKWIPYKPEFAIREREVPTAIANFR